MKCPECGITFKAVPLEVLQAFKEGLEVASKSQAMGEFYRGALWLCEILMKLAQEA